MGVLRKAIEDLNRPLAIKLVSDRLVAGEAAVDILGECRDGMTRVGELFQQGEYYLSELMLSAEIFKDAVNMLSPYLTKVDEAEPVAKVVLATMRGDIHDLGKNILATLLKVQSFAVYDLGVNVEPTDLLRKVKEINPEFVGISALITASFDSAKEAVDMLEHEGLRKRFKLMVGGGVTTESFKKHVGADFQSHDATAAVEYCLDHARAVSHA